MRNDIKVSFKDNEEENLLYDNIINQSKFIGKSSWMKLAAREKIEKELKPQKKNDFINTNQQSGIINSLDDLFKN